MKIRKAINLASLLMLGFAASLVSCQNFFTTSLGTPFVRDSSTLVANLTVDNVADCVESAKNDQSLSLAILDSLSSLIDTASAEEVPALQSAALDAAVNASGVGTAIGEIISDSTVLDIVLSGDLSDQTTQDELIGYVDDVLTGLDNLSEASSLLVDVLPDPTDTTAYAAFVDSSTPEQLAMAAVTLLADAATSSGDDLVTFVSTLDTSDSEIALAMDLATSAADKYAVEGGTGAFSSILSAFGLIS